MKELLEPFAAQISCGFSYLFWKPLRQISPFWDKTNPWKRKMKLWENKNASFGGIFISHPTWQSWTLVPSSQSQVRQWQWLAARIWGQVRPKLITKVLMRTRTILNLTTARVNVIITQKGTKHYLGRAGLEQDRFWEVQKTRASRHCQYKGRDLDRTRAGQNIELKINEERTTFPKVLRHT